MTQEPLKAKFLQAYSSAQALAHGLANQGFALNKTGNGLFEAV